MRSAAITWFNGILAFLIIWWIVLFAVLPWGVRVPNKVETGHAASAPERPMIWRKAAVTTLISALLWIALYFLVQSDLIAVRP